MPSRSNAGMIETRSSGAASSIVMSAPVTAARPMKLATSMCSGPIRCAPPRSRSTPAIPQHVRADARDLGAERDEEVAEVLDVRLAGGVHDRRLARRERGRHHGVLGRHHRRLVEEDLRAAKPVGAHLVALADRDLGAEALERVEVRVEPAPADHVAAGRRHGRAAEPREQRAGEQERGADPVGEHLVGLVSRDLGGVHAHLVRAGPLDVGAESLQQADHRLDVVDPRHVRRASPARR